MWCGAVRKGFPPRVIPLGGPRPLSSLCPTGQQPMKSEGYDGERDPVRPSVHPAAIAITALRRFGFPVAKIGRHGRCGAGAPRGRLSRPRGRLSRPRRRLCRSPPVANVGVDGARPTAAPGRAFRPFYGRAEPANTALKGLDHVENVGDDLAVENRRGRRASARRRTGPR